jgi:hypothetical protein
MMSTSTARTIASHPATTTVTIEIEHCPEMRAYFVHARRSGETVETHEHATEDTARERANTMWMRYRRLARPAAPAAPWAPGHEDYRRATNAAERAHEDAEAARVPTRRAPADEGMYRKDGVIYKVQIAVHGSGKPYAKRLEFVEGQDMGDSGLRGTWHFVYDRGAVRELGPEHRLTLEQAKEFGALYGTCCVCGRTLTDEKSIAAGIGPVCAGKF